jgi:hypothetical protein
MKTSFSSREYSCCEFAVDMTADGKPAQGISGLTRSTAKPASAPFRCWQAASWRYANWPGRSLLQQVPA